MLLSEHLFYQFSIIIKYYYLVLSSISILRIRGKLSEGERSGLPISDIVKERLEAHVAKIVSKLPEDLQAVIKSKS